MCMVHLSLCTVLYTQMYSEHSSNHVDGNDDMDPAAQQNTSKVKPGPDVVPLLDLEVQ